MLQLAIPNDGGGPQCDQYPLNHTYPTTNWGRGLAELRWWHLTVVNDGRLTSCT